MPKPRDNLAPKWANKNLAYNGYFDTHVAIRNLNSDSCKLNVSSRFLDSFGIRKLILSEATLKCDVRSKKEKLAAKRYGQQ